MQPERRAWVRYECPRPIPRSLRMDICEGRVNDSWIVNMSIGGLALMVPVEVPLGTRLIVELESKPQEAPVVLRAAVVRAEKKNEGEWLIGCLFDKPMNTERLKAILL